MTTCGGVQVNVNFAVPPVVLSGHAVVEIGMGVPIPLYAGAAAGEADASKPPIASANALPLRSRKRIARP